MLHCNVTVFSESYFTTFNSNVIYMWQHRHTDHELLQCCHSVIA